MSVINYLINKSRAFIYTTSLAPASVAAALAAIEIIEKEPEKRNRLLENSEKLRNKLKEKSFDTLDSESQIIPLLTESIENTVSFSNKLLE